MTALLYTMQDSAAEGVPSASPLVADGKGEGGNRAVLALLDTRVEFMQFCPVCDCEQQFVAGWECALGLIGCCLGCGEEKLISFSRTVA